MAPHVRLRALAAILFVSIALAPCDAQDSGALRVDEAATRVSFPANHFQLSLSLANGGTPSSALVTAELLDVDDSVLSSATAPCNLVTGKSVCQVEMPPATVKLGRQGGYGDILPLVRVRYSVAAASAPPVSGILALDHIAPDLFDLHIAALKDIRRGAAYTARVRALHPLTHASRAGVPLKVTLNANYQESGKESGVLGQLHVITDAEGFASIPFAVPTDADLLSIDLNVEGTLANLHPGTSQTLAIPDNARFDLTTDKPLYQPGQTVHMRLLRLDRNGRATAQKNVQVDVSDPDDTLVFRAEAATSQYGIASVDWPVPARLRLGEYTLRAKIPDDSDERQTAYERIRVSRYDLPTFVVAPVPDRPFYLPGSNATVDVRANYLFGNPVLHGHVRVVSEDDRTWNYTEQKYDVKEGKAVSGELDGNVSFRAHIPLAADLEQYRDSEARNEFEDLHYAAYVTDASTGRTEPRRFDIRIAAQAIHLYIVQGEQAKGMPGQFYLAATTADGMPVECDVSFSLLPYEEPHDTLRQRTARVVPLGRLHTDANGLARLNLPTYEKLLKLVPAALHPEALTSEEQPTIYVTARDKDGRTGAITQTLMAPAGTFQVTTPRAIYRPGDPINIEIASAEASAPLTVQMVRRTFRGGLLLATRDITLVNGHASLTIPSDEQYSGLVFIQVVALGTSSGETADYYGYTGSSDPQTTLASHALLFPRDNSLHVGIHMSAETFAPGDQATAALDVKGPQDPDGDDRSQAPSALGIVAIDEAVEERSRTDNDFGGANSQSFFFHGYSEYDGGESAGGFMLDSLARLEPGKPIPSGSQLAAEMLLAGQRLAFDIANNAAEQELPRVFHDLFQSQLGPARFALARYLDTHTELPTTKPELAALLAKSDIDLLGLRDPWGTPYSLKATAENDGTLTLELHRDGPDKTHATADDFDVPFSSWHWFNGHQRELVHAIGAFHQRTGRFIRNIAGLHGEMQTEGVDFDHWRDPWGQSFTFKFAIVQTNFVISALSRGDPQYKPRYDYEKGPFTVGSAAIDYSTEIRKRIETALEQYATSHPYPKNDAGVEAALRMSGISRSRLTDPWGHPLFVTFRSHSFFTDTVRIEVHATPDSAPQNRTIITPVTAVSDIVELHGLGPDSKRSTSDDFIYATFSRVRSLQSAQDTVAKRATHQTVHSGQTGNIAGTIADITGAVIPGAVVVATNQKTGMEYEEKSDNDGDYLLGPLPVGDYNVRFRAKGFNDLVYDQVNVLPHNTVALDAKLNVGGATQTIEVSATALTLSTDSAMVTTQQISSLPLMKIAPGLVSGGGGGVMSTPRLRDYFPETLLWRP